MQTSPPADDSIPPFEDKPWTEISQQSFDAAEMLLVPGAVDVAGRTGGRPRSSDPQRLYHCGWSAEDCCQNTPPECRRNAGHGAMPGFIDAPSSSDANFSARLLAFPASLREIPPHLGAPGRRARIEEAVYLASKARRWSRCAAAYHRGDAGTRRGSDVSAVARATQEAGCAACSASSVTIAGMTVARSCVSPEIHLDLLVFQQLVHPSLAYQFRKWRPTRC